MVGSTTAEKVDEIHSRRKIATSRVQTPMKAAGSKRAGRRAAGAAAVTAAISPAPLR
jgi:hypothetical protein